MNEEFVFGIFEGGPSIFTDNEAWVFYRDRWRRFNAAEILFHAGVIMSRAKFDKTFIGLPPLPPGAFSRLRSRPWPPKRPAYSARMRAKEFYRN